MTTLSVISSSRRAGSRPAWSRIAATFEISPDSANWRADRLTLTARRDAAGIRRCQSRSWWHAVSRTQRPIGRIRPVSSASGMNESGGNDPARRVLPAQQRLHAQHGARGEVDQRLVVEPQLGSLDRPPQVALEGRPVDGLGVHLGIEQDRPADRVRLRPVEGDLGLLEQVERMRQRGMSRPRSPCWPRPSARCRRGRTGPRWPPRSCDATRSVSRTLRTGPRRIPNSSEPRRATVSVERAAVTRRSPTCASS